MAFVRHREHFYYWAKGVFHLDESRRVLVGFDFDGGPSARSPVPIAGQVWSLSSSGNVLLKEDCYLMHFSQRGWHVCAQEGSFPCPCLLTSDPGIGLRFHGHVNATSNDSSVELASAIGDGMSVIGQDWLGVVQSTASGLLLTAFSESVEALLPTTAYHPDWSPSESLDEQSDSFVLRLSPRAEPGVGADSR